MSEAIVARLEAVAARLEKLAAGGRASGGSVEEDIPEVVSEFDLFISTDVQPFLDACAAMSGTAAMGTEYSKALGSIRSVVAASAVCTKPSQGDLMSLLTDCVAVITAASTAGDRADKKSEFFCHTKAFAEVVTGFNWVCVPGTKKTCIAALEASDFYLTKILVAAKGMDDTAKGQHRAFVSSLKNMITKMGDYCQQYHKTGVSWQAKGKTVAEFQASGGAAPAADVPPPPGPPPASLEKKTKPKASGAGMSDVFAAISKGGAITSGLKKVTDNMKAKNNKDKAVLKPKERKAVAPKKKWGAAPVKKEPKMALSKGTWFIENYETDTVIPEAELEIKHNIYILKARNCTITVPIKVKSIQVDGCYKVNIVFQSVVSLCEVFNSQRVKVICLQTVPAVAIDKVQGASIILETVEAKNAPPTIVTSNVSELNFVVPGANPDKDDPIEIPLPEQYTSTYDPTTGKISTEPVTHGG
jgi:adenylyl cyclase-associated protein